MSMRMYSIEKRGKHVGNHMGMDIERNKRKKDIEQNKTHLKPWVIKLNLHHPTTRKSMQRIDYCHISRCISKEVDL